MAILPALDWLLAHWRSGTAAPQVQPLIGDRPAAEARVNAELPLARRRSAATLLGGQVLPCRATPRLAALLRPVMAPPVPDRAGTVDHSNAGQVPRLAAC